MPRRFVASRRRSQTECERAMWSWAQSSHLRIHRRGQYHASGVSVAQAAFGAGVGTVCYCDAIFLLLGFAFGWTYGACAGTSKGSRPRCS